MLVELKMYLQQMDVCTAYLKSPLSPLKHPTIFDDDECKDSVLRLNKATKTGMTRVERHFRWST